MSGAKTILSIKCGQLFLNIPLGNMNVLWLFFGLHLAVAQPGFGKSYLSNSRLCHEWACVNTRLGLLDYLPPKQQFSVLLRSKLPQGAWQETVEAVLTTCYDSRPRRYSNTCPGQALLHCVVDQLIENCPEESLNKDDACSPVQSLAGSKYMFSQRVYKNFQENLAIERRPSWFLNNYFNAKCCDVPLIIRDELSGCGLSVLMHYEYETPRYDPIRIAANLNFTTAAPVALNVIESSNDGDVLKIVSLKNIGDNVKITPISAQTAHNGDPSEISNLKENANHEIMDLTDPLDCCDMKEFIRPSWRSECDFKMKWDDERRISIENITHMITTELPTTTTVKSIKTRDLMLMPYSCEKENCVFQKLNVVTETGSVDVDAFMKLLDKLTESQPWWTKAKARVVTTCLKKPLIEYEADCEINKILSCTFDVLTENCPFKTKDDLCKHTRNNAVCQISSSKYRPRKRRDVCYLPELVSHNLLTECGMTTLSYAKPAPETLIINKVKKHSVFSSRYTCKDQTPSTTCLMGKMGILNKYSFMDYFKMKDRIRQFTSTQPEWSALVDLFVSAFTNIPMYREHCSSAKKLLNVVDTMLMTCPIARRKNTPQCAKIFSEMTNSAPVKQQNVTQEKFDEILQHFHHVFMPTVYKKPRLGWLVRPKHIRKIVKKPIYDYGLLSSKNVPPVRIINVKTITAKPLILLPVYRRVPQNKNHILKPYVNDGIMRGSPFWLHTQIAMVHANATNPAITTSTSVPVNTPVSDNTSISTAKPVSTISTTTEDFQRIILP